MLTVRELLGDLDVRLLTGEASLDAPVRWVHISELEDPTPFLSGGELLLTTGLQLGTAAEQRAYLDRLADHQLAGLGFGTGFGHDTVPAALLEAATERDFAVIEVPYELPFIALTERAFARLVNEQYAVLQRAIAAHERLERIVLSERGLDAVAGTLATLVGGTVLVLDGRGEPLARRVFRRELPAEAAAAVRREIGDRTREGEPRIFVPAAPELAGRSLALPVWGDRESGREAGAPRAWIVAAKDSGGLDEFDRLTLHQAVTIVALELLRRRVAEDTERRLAGDVLSNVISGALAGEELVRRLAPFGIGSRAGALVAAPPRGGAEACESALGDALRDEAVDGLVASHDRLVCALLPGAEDDDLFALAAQVQRRTSAGVGQAVPMGVGRAAPAGEARRAFHEARCALEARTFGLAGEPAGNGHANGNGNGHSPGPAPLATFRDLGSFQLLLSLQDGEALRLFCDSILGPIESGDGHYGGELMRSLEAFIECNGQWERAARQLYCHRHTLRYRIRKVEELTGRDLSSARDRIEFWLALRGRELVA